LGVDEKMSEKKLYMISELTIFRNRYVIEATEEQLENFLSVGTTEDLKHEFSQEHIDSIIVEHYPIDEETYLKIFDKDNTYMGRFSNEKKFDFINKFGR
jgi:hypothetical protein